MYGAEVYCVEKLGLGRNPSEDISDVHNPEHAYTLYPHLPICFSMEPAIFGSLLK